MFDCCFIIPNFNGEQFIANTVQEFRSVFPSTLIVVVDDCSTDSSIEVLQNVDCELICRQTNGGFAAAVNSGLQYAIEKGYLYACIANSDVSIHPALRPELDSLVKMLGANDQLGVIGFQEAGTKKRAVGYSMPEVSGFFFFLRTSLTEVIGFFDEEFIMYGEEQDYFRRVVGAGFEVFQSDVTLSHKGEGSGGGLSASWLTIRNALLLEVKWSRRMKFFYSLVSIFLQINRLYRPTSGESNPSNLRIRRCGMLRGNLFLIQALLFCANWKNENKEGKKIAS